MLEEELITTDVLVVGVGIAGLRASLTAKRYNVSVTIAASGWGASPYISAINAPFADVDERDSPEVYYQDTLRGGLGLNNRRLVSILCSQAIPSIRELEDLGMEFDKVNGRHSQRLVSGGTYPRAIHREDRTGSELAGILHRELKKQKIKILSPVRIIKIVKKDGRIKGAFGLDLKNGRFLIINAKAVVLATGGIGHTYQFTTYPEDITGEGIALAYCAGAQLVDMEFVQFEPTVILHPERCRGSLIPTAMFGEGGRLLNKNGKRFMLNSKYRSEAKAQKHQLALAIARQVKEGRGTEHGGVYFDASRMPAKILKGYSSHLQKLLSAGFDLKKDLVEIGPCAHSLIGGIKIDGECRTKVEGLFAAGEVAGGVHGANRIAGNGATEAIVFGRIAGESAGKYAAESSLQRVSRDEILFAKERLLKIIDTGGSAIPPGEAPDLAKLKLQKETLKAAGMLRSANALKRGIDEVEQIRREKTGLLKAKSLHQLVQCLEIDNMTVAAEAVFKAALTRCESRGAHQRTDCPHMDNDNWLKNVVLLRQNKKMHIKLLKYQSASNRA